MAVTEKKSTKKKWPHSKGHPGEGGRLPKCFTLAQLKAEIRRLSGWKTASSWDYYEYLTIQDDVHLYEVQVYFDPFQISVGCCKHKKWTRTLTFRDALNHDVSDDDAKDYWQLVNWLQTNKSRLPKES